MVRFVTFHGATVQKISASTTTEYVRSHDGIKWIIYTKQTTGFLGEGGYFIGITAKVNS